MYKQNKSLHKINLWIILQYVKQNTISNTIPLKVLATLFYNNVQMYVVFSIFYILIMMFPLPPMIGGWWVVARRQSCRHAPRRLLIGGIIDQSRTQDVL